MRIKYLALLVLYSFPLYADCNCNGNVYLNLIYKDHWGFRSEVSIIGNNWPRSSDGVVVPKKLFYRQLEEGARFEIVKFSTTMLFETKKHGTESANFIVRSGRMLDKKSVARVEEAYVVWTGCAAYPPSVREENYEIVSKTKPVRVEVHPDKKHGGVTYRIFFKKKDKLIWLRYSPDFDGECPPSKIKWPDRPSKLNGWNGIQVVSGGCSSPCYKLKFPEEFGLNNSEQLELLTRLNRARSKFVVDDIDGPLSIESSVLDHLLKLSITYQYLPAATILLQPHRAGMNLSIQNVEAYEQQFILPLVRSFKDLDRLIGKKHYGEFATSICGWLERDGGKDEYKDFISFLRSKGMNDLAEGIANKCQ